MDEQMIGERERRIHRKMTGPSEKSNKLNLQPEERATDERYNLYLHPHPFSCAGFLLP